MSYLLKKKRKKLLLLAHASPNPLGTSFFTDESLPDSYLQENNNEDLESKDFLSGLTTNSNLVESKDNNEAQKKKSGRSSPTSLTRIQALEVAITELSQENQNSLEVLSNLQGDIKSLAHERAQDVDRLETLIEHYSNVTSQQFNELTQVLQQLQNNFVSLANQNTQLTSNASYEQGDTSSPTANSESSSSLRSVREVLLAGKNQSKKSLQNAIGFDNNKEFPNFQPLPGTIVRVMFFFDSFITNQKTGRQEFICTKDLPFLFVVEECLSPIIMKNVLTELKDLFFDKFLKHFMHDDIKLRATQFKQILPVPKDVSLNTLNKVDFGSIPSNGSYPVVAPFQIALSSTLKNSSRNDGFILLPFISSHFNRYKPGTTNASYSKMDSFATLLNDSIQLSSGLTIRLVFQTTVANSPSPYLIASSVDPLGFRYSAKEKEKEKELNMLLARDNSLINSKSTSATFVNGDAEQSTNGESLILD